MKKIAYSIYFDSYISLKLRVTNNYWFFKQCDKNGNEFGPLTKADTSYSYFDWKKLPKS